MKKTCIIIGILLLSTSAMSELFPEAKFIVKGVSEPTLEDFRFKINSQGYVEVYEDRVNLKGYCNTCSIDTSEGNDATCTANTCEDGFNELEAFVLKTLRANGLRFVQEHMFDDEFKVHGAGNWVQLERIVLQ